MSLPQTMNIEGNEIPLSTFKYLDSKPRTTLKNLAMNLRDAIGADRLPPLTASGSVEVLTCWIIDVQCMLAQAIGLQITAADLGKPANYGVSDTGFMGGPQAPKGVGTDRGVPEFNVQPNDAAMAQAAATKAKNQRGSNIFGGGDDDPTMPKQQRQPMQPLQQAGPNDMASMAAYEAAMDQAAATRARNQRGSNIFG